MRRGASSVRDTGEVFGRRESVYRAKIRTKCEMKDIRGQGGFKHGTIEVVRGGAKIV